MGVKRMRAGAAWAAGSARVPEFPDCDTANVYAAVRSVQAGGAIHDMLNWCSTRLGAWGSKLAALGWAGSLPEGTTRFCFPSPKTGAGLSDGSDRAARLVSQHNRWTLRPLLQDFAEQAQGQDVRQAAGVPPVS